MDILNCRADRSIRELSDRLLFCIKLYANTLLLNLSYHYITRAPFALFPNSPPKRDDPPLRPFSIVFPFPRFLPFAFSFLLPFFPLPLSLFTTDLPI